MAHDEDPAAASPDDPQPPSDEAVRRAMESVDEITADLLDQLELLSGALRERSARDLVDALDDLQQRLAVLQELGPGNLGAAALQALESISAAAARIERARLRLEDDITAPRGGPSTQRHPGPHGNGGARRRPDRWG